MSGRRLALAALGAVALALLAWLAIPRPAVPLPVEPAVDLELPAERARLDAALALARMPDDPWTFAEAIPVAPAAGAAPQRCGTDQRPVYRAPQAGEGTLSGTEEEAKPGGAAYLGATRRIDAALRASTDAFDRAVADALNVGAVLTPAGRIAALVQDATSTGDARVYALAFRACQAAYLQPDPQGSCTRLDARQWALLDAGNALPWLYVLDQADADDDAARREEALRQMASAARFDNRAHAAAAAVAGVRLADDADLAAQLDLSVQALAMSMAQGLPIRSLMATCRAQAGADAERMQRCESIGDVMFGHTDSMLVRSLGAAIHAWATGDGSWRAEVRKEVTALGDHWTPATGFSVCDDIRDQLSIFRRVARSGEVAAANAALHGAMPP